LALLTTCFRGGDTFNIIFITIKWSLDDYKKYIFD